MRVLRFELVPVRASLRLARVLRQSNCFAIFYCWRSVKENRSGTFRCSILHAFVFLTVLNMILYCAPCVPRIRSCSETLQLHSRPRVSQRSQKSFDTVLHEIRVHTLDWHLQTPHWHSLRLPSISVSNLFPALQLSPSSSIPDYLATPCHVWQRHRDGQVDADLPRLERERHLPRHRPGTCRPRSRHEAGI